MLKQRIITALLLGAVLLAAIFYLPPSWFAVVAGLVFVLAAWEWSRLAHFAGAARLVFTFAFGCLLLASAYWLGLEEMQAGRLCGILAVAVLWWLVASWLVISYPARSELWARRWVQTVMGVMVIIPTWAALSYLRAEPGGEWLIVILAGCVICADTGAFFVGRRWGKRKLAPAVSPGKSVEGFAGGMLCSLIFALVLIFAMGAEPGDWRLLALVVPASLASVMGDLLESMLKRQRGIKDSGRILPGHGGILDRIDSITAAAPVFALAYMSSGWQL